MLEDTRAEEWCRHPNRMQHRDGREERCRLRHGGAERLVRSLETRLDDRDRALVLRMSRIRVQMLVQRRRGAEDKCEEERAQRCKGNGSAAVHGPNLFQLWQKRNRVATCWLTTARASCHSDRSGGTEPRGRARRGRSPEGVSERERVNQSLASFCF